MLILTELTCVVIKFELLKQREPAFSYDFVEALKVLAAADSLSVAEKEAAYYLFTENYGTHYITSGAFGAKVTNTYLTNNDLDIYYQTNQLH